MKRVLMKSTWMIFIALEMFSHIFVQKVILLNALNTSYEALFLIKTKHCVGNKDEKDSLLASKG